MIQGTDNSVLNINNSFYGPAVNNPAEQEPQDPTSQNQTVQPESENLKIQETDKGNLMDVTI